MEFVEVIKQMKRMCAHFSPTCNGCKLCLGKGTDEFCGESPNDILSDPALVETAVMSWAAEHPEPQYPTWEEWLVANGVMESDIVRLNGDYRFYYNGKPVKNIPSPKMFDPIPADIAEKLGIEPKHS